MKPTIINRDGSIVNYTWCSAIEATDSGIYYYARDGRVFIRVEYDNPDEAAADVAFIQKAMGWKAWFINLNRNEYKI